MAQMNGLAIALSALLGFLVVSLWYGPFFGHAWRRGAGLSISNFKRPPAPILYGAALLYSILAAVFVGHLLANFPGRPAHVYLMITGGIGLGFILPTLGLRCLFMQTSKQILFIDVVGWTLFYLVMGVVYAFLG
jgi:hypothetical protein